MKLYISVSFHDTILNEFKLKSKHESTIVKFQRGITPKVYRQELRFLGSARYLMMLYVFMKFLENILNGREMNMLNFQRGIT